MVRVSDMTHMKTQKEKGKNAKFKKMPFCQKFKALPHCAPGGSAACYWYFLSILTYFFFIQKFKM